MERKIAKHKFWISKEVYVDMMSDPISLVKVEIDDKGTIVLDKNNEPIGIDHKTCIGVKRGGKLINRQGNLLRVLTTLYNKGEPIHRYRLIVETLTEEEFHDIYAIRNGKIKTVEEVINDIDRGLWHPGSKNQKIVKSVEDAIRNLSKTIKQFCCSTEREYVLSDVSEGNGNAKNSLYTEYPYKNEKENPWTRGGTFIEYQDGEIVVGEENIIRREADTSVENDGPKVDYRRESFPQSAEFETERVFIREDREDVSAQLDDNLEKSNYCKKSNEEDNPKNIVSTEEFFSKHLHNNISSKKIRGIDMNFHSGMSWLIRGVLHDVLIRVLDEGIPFRIIVNTPESIGWIASHMRDNTASYLTFSQCIEEWKKLRLIYPNLEVKTSAIPFIHNYHSISFIQPEECSYVYVMTYTYNNSDSKKNPIVIMDSSSDTYPLYRDEFEYLWKSGNAI